MGSGLNGLNEKCDQAQPFGRVPKITLLDNGRLSPSERQSPYCLANVPRKSRISSPTNGLSSAIRQHANRCSWWWNVAEGHKNVALPTQKIGISTQPS